MNENNQKLVLTYKFITKYLKKIMQQPKLVVFLKDIKPEILYVAKYWKGVERT